MVCCGCCVDLCVVCCVCVVLVVWKCVGLFVGWVCVCVVCDLGGVWCVGCVVVVVGEF